MDVCEFTNKILAKIAELGPYHGADHARLTELATGLECTEWIQDVSARVRMKRDIYEDMRAFCTEHPVNKRILFAQHQTGAYVALAAAISHNPESGDGDLLLDLRTGLITKEWPSTRFSTQSFHCVRKTYCQRRS